MGKAKFFYTFSVLSMSKYNDNITSKASWALKVSLLVSIMTAPSHESKILCNFAIKAAANIEFSKVETSVKKVKRSSKL